MEAKENSNEDEIVEIMKLVFEWTPDNKLTPNPFVLVAMQAIIDIHIQECLADEQTYKEKYAETKSWRFDSSAKKSAASADFLRRMFHAIESGYNFNQLHEKMKLFIKPTQIIGAENAERNLGTSDPVSDRSSTKERIHSGDSGSDTEEGKPTIPDGDFGSDVTDSGDSKESSSAVKMDDGKSVKQVVQLTDTGTKRTGRKGRKIHV